MTNDSPWDGPRVDLVPETASEHYTPRTRAEQDEERRLRDEVERLSVKAEAANAADPTAAYRHQLSVLVSMGSTPEEAATILNRRRQVDLAELAEGTTPLSADEAYDRLVGGARAGVDNRTVAPVSRTEYRIVSLRYPQAAVTHRPLNEETAGIVLPVWQRIDPDAYLETRTVTEWSRP